MRSAMPRAIAAIAAGAAFAVAVTGGVDKFDTAGIFDNSATSSPSESSSFSPTGLKTVHLASAEAAHIDRAIGVLDRVDALNPAATSAQILVARANLESLIAAYLRQVSKDKVLDLDGMQLPTQLLPAPQPSIDPDGTIDGRAVQPSDGVPAPDGFDADDLQGMTGTDGASGSPLTSALLGQAATLAKESSSVFELPDPFASASSDPFASAGSAPSRLAPSESVPTEPAPTARATPEGNPAASGNSGTGGAGEVADAAHANEPATDATAMDADPAVETSAEASAGVLSAAPEGASATGSTPSQPADAPSEPGDAVSGTEPTSDPRATGTGDPAEPTIEAPDPAASASPAEDAGSPQHEDHAANPLTGTNTSSEYEGGWVTLEDIEAAAQALADLLDAAPNVTPGAGGSDAAATPGGVGVGGDLAQQLADAVGMYADSTSGFQNGRIPTSALCPLTFASGHMLRCDAAMQLNALAVEFNKEFGYQLKITDSYRTLDSQIALKKIKPVLAAVPGTSQHGWGLAVDIGGNVPSGTSAEYVWLRIHGPDYGWDNPAWARLTGSKPEPWHFEFFAAGKMPTRYTAAERVGPLTPWLDPQGTGTSGSRSAGGSSGSGGSKASAGPTVKNPSTPTPGQVSPKPTTAPTDPGPTATPSQSPSTAAPSPSTGSPTPSASPSATPGPSHSTPSPSTTPSASPSGSASATNPGASPTPSASPSTSVEPSASPSAGASASPSVKPSALSTLFPDRTPFATKTTSAPMSPLAPKPSASTRASSPLSVSKPPEPAPTKAVSPTAKKPSPAPSPSPSLPVPGGSPEVAPSLSPQPSASGRRSTKAVPKQ